MIEPLRVAILKGHSGLCVPDRDDLQVPVVLGSGVRESCQNGISAY